MKHIETFKSSTQAVKVEWSKTNEEYRCRLYNVDAGIAKAYKPADYFTDDKQDALGTARAMLKCKDQLNLNLAISLHGMN